jgi:DNA-binding transcriptional LysR family regulator
MNTDWLRYYVALAETLNLQAAADRLHVTPQAVSKAIAGLEDQFKLKLVERAHRIQGLSPAGQALLEEARTILADLENAERRLAEWRAGQVQGPVTIAGDGLWNHYLLPPLLTALLGAHPRIRPKLHEMLPEDTERWVAAGEVDVGLLLQSPVRADLEWMEGISTPYVIAGKPLPEGQAPWQDLGYIVPRFFRREMAQSLDGWPENRFKRRIVAEVELLETAIHLAESGLGVAFLPELAVKERIERGTLAVVAEAPVTFEDQLFVVWRKGIRPTPAARELLKALGAL